MNAPTTTLDASIGFPRFFKIGGYSVSAYKVFLCIGIYSGILVSAARGGALWNFASSDGSRLFSVRDLRFVWCAALLSI